MVLIKISKASFVWRATETNEREEEGEFELGEVGIVGGSETLLFIKPNSALNGIKAELL